MYIISSIADQNHALHHRILILANAVVYATELYVIYHMVIMNTVSKNSFLKI